MVKLCIKKLNGFEVVDEETGYSYARAADFNEIVKKLSDINKRHKYADLKADLTRLFPNVVKHISSGLSIEEYLKDFKKFEELYNELSE